MTRRARTVPPHESAGKLLRLPAGGCQARRTEGPLARAEPSRRGERMVAAERGRPRALRAPGPLWHRPGRMARRERPTLWASTTLTPRGSQKSGGETQAEALKSRRRRSLTLKGSGLRHRTRSKAVDSAARPGRGQASQTTRASCGTGLRHSSMYPSVSPQGEAGGNEAAAKAPRQIKHDRGWSEFPMSNTNRSRPIRQQLIRRPRSLYRGAGLSPHPQPSIRQPGPTAFLCNG
jgi:hypothetical protein